MNNFYFQVPTKIYYGRDCIDNIKDELENSGSKVLITYGGGSVNKSGLLERIKLAIGDGFELFECGGIEPNPKMHSIRKGVEICKQNGIDMILAIGGGSVIDASKAIAAGACVDFDAWEFFGGPRRVIEKALPLYTVVTMASTGSEMTCGAVISNEETLEKTGRSGFPLFPRVSYLDPTLTYSVPRHQTACGAADIFSHIFECYFNRDSNFDFLSRMMEGAMKSVVSNAKAAMENPEDYEARGNLLWTASWAMNGLFAGGSRQMWSCHPIEHELSAKFDITHGLGLAIIMPKWLRYCMEEFPDTVEKVSEFGANVFGSKDAEGAVKDMEHFLYTELGLSDSLGDIGLEDIDTRELAKAVCSGGAIRGYCELDEDAVAKILADCK